MGETEPADRRSHVAALTPGVTLVLTRHVGPYKAALRGQQSLLDAAVRSSERDRRVLARDGEG